MKRLCGSVGRAAGKPPRRSTTNRAWHLLEGEAVVVPITLAAMPCCNHSHRETIKSVWMCAESTATVTVRGGHRGTVRHASAHTEQRTHPAVQKQRGEKNAPRAGNFTHGRHRAAASPFQHGTQANVPTFAKAFLQSAVQIHVCVCAGETEKEAQGSTSTQQEAQLDDGDTCGTAPTSTFTHGGSTHHSQKTKKRNLKNTAAGCGCVCGAASVCPPWPQKTKQNKREEMCAPPHRPSSHAHTSRLPQRAVRRGPSSCVQQARRTGPSSWACRWVCEWSSWAETHGTLTGRVRKKQLKREE
ncbi:hypothetical protein Tc00.1047053508873.25 [Trypanosoma cruzi]|uniref:Uncharacterized protein n=1 Tax=Trypanosoma cruzi (strain CL Brener) TaxID=353153 RepID=Q4E517_TRYCC|nr:hypothetical protein Tc00.1047053508873.25 [Trypanosoma cruzi]EAN99874.1 hypothetical protein Tc00.1047053508873.25 [Trypanosoma cruzi]|eukprot:XP_821725.1 hypothetical protein [Trypanosoma cruzi strain CL Brener]